MITVVQCEAIDNEQVFELYVPLYMINPLIDNPSSDTGEIEHLAEDIKHALLLFLEEKYVTPNRQSRITSDPMP